MKYSYLFLCLILTVSGCSQQPETESTELDSIEDQAAEKNEPEQHSPSQPQLRQLTATACKLTSEHIITANSDVDLVDIARVFNEKNEGESKFLFDSLKVVHPSASDVDLQRELVIMVYHDLVDNCTELNQLIVKMYGACPAENGMLRMLKDSTDAMLQREIEKPLVNYRMVNDKYADFITNLALSESNAGLMNESYGEDFMKFLDEQEVYMYHKSKSYFKMILGSIIQSN